MTGIHASTKDFSRMRRVTGPKTLPRRVYAYYGIQPKSQVPRNPQPPIPPKYSLKPKPRPVIKSIKKVITHPPKKVFRLGKGQVVRKKIKGFSRPLRKA